MPFGADEKRVSRLLTRKERWLVFGCFVISLECSLLYLTTSWFVKSIPRPEVLVAKGSAERREVTASVFDAYVQSKIELHYDSSAERGAPVKIEATITQQLLFRRSPSYPDTGDDTPKPQVLDELRWPIELSLDQGKIVRKLAKGTLLPVILDWAPVISASGDKAIFVLNLKNFNGSETPRSNNELSLEINGIQKKANPSNDIPLTIKIYKNGIPAGLWEKVTLGGAALAFVLGSSILTRAIGRAWKSLSRSRGSSRNWEGEGVVLPETTQLRMSHNGIVHEGTIRDGLWVIGGKSFSSPSAAANGLGSRRKAKGFDSWSLWQVKRPKDAGWVAMDSLRNQIAP
jgi:hypothetical protein